MPPRATLITLNDVEAPRTGGDEVYRRIHGALKARYGEVATHTAAGRGAPGYLACLAASAEATRGGGLVFTSASPTFPVLGHATYHQPKGGTLSRHASGERLDRRLACLATGREALSPLWLLTKRSLLLHLANSEYTRRLVKARYGADSTLLYPAVPAPAETRAERRRTVLVTKPERISGVEDLPRAAARLPTGASLTVMGRIDDAGRRALRELRRMGVPHAYIGYVPEEEKRRAMAGASVHLNLVVNESFGLSTVEAMSHGAVAVAHRSGAPPEYLPPGHLYDTPQEAGEVAAQFLDAGEEERGEARRIAAGFSERRFSLGLGEALRRLEAELERRAKP